MVDCVACRSSLHLALRDPSPEVRQAAREVLGRLAFLGGID